MRICHLTSAHPRFDIRIFHKICCSLANAGYETKLIVADGKGDEERSGIHIYDVGLPRGRVQRMWTVTRKILEKAILIDADVYHFHDPELIPVGVRLKRNGKRVIFDSHEDVPKQILSKPYLSKPLRWLISEVYSVYETWASRRLDGIIAATPTIAEKFRGINRNTIDVNNFPILNELTNDVIWENKRAEVCYVGGLASVRGIREIVSSLSLLPSDIRLNLAGTFVEPEVEAELKESLEWGRVNEFGFLDRAGVKEVLARSIGGLVTLHPIANYLDALPIKMFEYMAAGIPAIASNFPLWREIVEKNECGICVDPLNPSDIAAAITYLFDHPEKARKMGENGRRAVRERYNWQAEERKLLSFYTNILSPQKWLE